jgi:hypothetical protein
MRPPGWPDEVDEPDAPDFLASAIRWLWDISPMERSPESVWSAYPEAHAFRVTYDINARIEGARQSYSRARSELAHADVPLDAVLEALESEGAALQRLQREVGLVQEAMAGRRWGTRP